MTLSRKFAPRAGVLALVLAGTALGGVAGGVAIASGDNAPGTQLTAPEAASVPRAGAHSSLADMVEAVGPSVVQIQVKPQAQPQQLRGSDPRLSQREEMLGRFFGFGSPERQGPQRGALGSGFVIDPSGLVVTNNHVVADADIVAVQFSDGREFEGRVLGRDEKTDLAVVKIEGGGRFQAIAWGDSDHSRVGDSVFAVGSPFGLGSTVTSGIISARSREIGAGPYDDFLQVDAAINTGNSGGPLFDASGQVIGVNTAIFSPSGGNVGIGFAIPARIARDVARQIVDNGGVERGRIGVVLQSVTADMAEALSLDEHKGALIAEVDASGPAARSGIRAGDVIRRFAGTEIGDGGDLARAVAEADAGSSVPVEIVRQGRRMALDLRIGSDSAARS